MLRAHALARIAGFALALTLASQSLAQSASPTGLAGQLGRENTAGALPLKRITLFRSGVGSFQRRGLVDGDAAVQLRFKTDQINDILKSMVVLDMSKGQGRIDGISYASKEPLARRLASFGVDISDNPAAAELLSRLRGSPVRISGPSGDVSGTVLNIDNKPTIVTGREGAPAKFDLPWINLLTDNGVRSVNLSEATGFEILDKGLADELAKALAALAEHRADRTKTVDVHLSGQGARDVLIAYVQESPVWKVSYRLVLPDAKPGDAKADLAAPPDTFTVQGWAIVENTSDEDWKDVTLSLVSGRPVSFQMDLYEPLYLTRPTLPVPMEPGAMSRVFEGGTGTLENERARRADAAKAGRPSRAPGAVPAAPAPEGAPMFALSDALATGGNSPFTAEDMAGYAAASQARGVETGEVFQFELDHPVTVERQRSAMLPIINQSISGRRVSIFSGADGSKHPMRGVEVTNSSNLPLLPGPISVFDGGSYAGDAQIGHVPRGDKRLLAYSLDLDVNASREDTGSQALRSVRIVKGFLEVSHATRNATTYTFNNKDLARARTVIIEHPKTPGWSLESDAKPTETTDTLYRFELAIEPGKTASKAIEQSYINMQTLQLTSVDLDTMLAFQKSGKVSDKVLEAFREAARRQGVISTITEQIASLEKERADISVDQTRIRENLKNIDRQSELYTRYIKKLNEQETRLEAITTELAGARERLAKAQVDLNTYIGNLNVE